MSSPSMSVLTRLSCAFVIAASIPAVQAQPVMPDEADNTPSGGAMLADLVLGRPLGLAATVLGTAVFVVGLPFEALSGDLAGPAHRLVEEPAEFTFSRPLGETP